MAKYSFLTFPTLKRALFKILHVALTLIFLLSSPILLLCYGILFLYRLSISKIAIRLDPKLGKMVSSLSSLFAAHDVYTNSYTVNVALHVVGKIDRLHIIHAFENLMASSVTPQGEPLYPELTQRLVRKFGYMFWRNLDNFQVDHHVTYLNPENPDEPLNLQNIRELIAAFGKTPMDPSRSPWHVYIIKNFTSEKNPAVKSAIILRLHHVMFDGYSVFNVFGKLADNGPLELEGAKALEQVMNQSAERPFANRLVALLKPIAMGVYGPHKLVGNLLKTDDNELIRINRKHFKGVMRFHECEPIPLKELKAIKNFYKVTLTTLISTLIARGLKRVLERRKIYTKKIHMMFPLPVFNHPDKLRNYFSGCVLSIDMTHDDRLKSLRAMEQKYNEFRFTFAMGLPEISLILLKVLGSLPVFLAPRIDNVPLCTTLMHTSFPGPVNMGYFCGFPIVDSTVAGSISKPYPTGTFCYSYNGMYKFGLSGDASVFSTQEELEEVGDSIYQEFLDFSQAVKENNV